MGDFSLDMFYDYEAIRFLKRYNSESVEAGAFPEVIKYDLIRFIGEGEPYYFGSWSLFDDDVEMILSGPTCIVKLDEIGDSDLEHVKKEMEGLRDYAM